MVTRSMTSANQKSQTDVNFISQMQQIHNTIQNIKKLDTIKENIANKNSVIAPDQIEHAESEDEEKTEEEEKDSDNNDKRRPPPPPPVPAHLLAKVGRTPQTQQT
eukprot:UN15272